MNKYTHYVVLEMFNENDSQKSDLKWVNQSYVADNVHFWMSHLLHDNRDKFDKQRIAVLIYHTAIFKDEVNMKIAKCETKNEVIIALWDQRLIDVISSDLENDKQEKVLFYHSVIMKIQKICSTSNALIDLQSWNLMKMLKEKSLLFSQNLQQVKKFVEYHWKSALNQMRRAYERMKETEIAVYKFKFYFYCVKNDIESMKKNIWSDLWTDWLSIWFIKLFFFIYLFFLFLLMIKKQSQVEWKMNVMRSLATFLSRLVKKSRDWDLSQW